MMELPPLPEPFVDDYFWLSPDGEQEAPLWDASQMRFYAAAAVAAAIAEEREACALTVLSTPPHQWVDGSDQWGNPCPAKIVTTRTDYAAAIRARSAPRTQDAG